jgi:hypothetical protein
VMLLTSTQWKYPWAGLAPTPNHHESLKSVMWTSGVIDYFHGFTFASYSWQRSVRDTCNTFQASDHCGKSATRTPECRGLSTPINLESIGSGEPALAARWYLNTWPELGIYLTFSLSSAALTWSYKFTSFSDRFRNFIGQRFLCDHLEKMTWNFRGSEYNFCFCQNVFLRKPVF